MSTTPPTPSSHGLSPDMRDLLIRLDQRVGDGFAAINAKLDRIEARADGHDSRIQNIELQLADRPAMIVQMTNTMDDVEAVTRRVDTIETTAKTARTMVTAVWTVLGGTILTLAARLAGLI